MNFVARLGFDWIVSTLRLVILKPACSVMNFIANWQENGLPEWLLIALEIDARLPAPNAIGTRLWAVLISKQESRREMVSRRPDLVMNFVARSGFRLARWLTVGSLHFAFQEHAHLAELVVAVFDQLVGWFVD